MTVRSRPQTRRLVRDLIAAGWTPGEVADQLGVHRATIYRHAARLRLEAEADRAAVLGGLRAYRASRAAAGVGS